MRPAFGGIDFGTSNSTVGVIENGRPRLVPLEEGNVTLPSAIFFNFEDNGTYFGREAVGQYTDAVEGRLMRALKSVLGSSLVHEKTRVKARYVAFTDIIGMFVTRLKAKLDAHAGENIETVVLGRPVQFVDDDEVADAAAQDELEKAARKQGFKNIAFQFEPIAAALDYEQNVTREELALIVDMGGGTSDFSIVRVSPQRAGASFRIDGSDVGRSNVTITLNTRSVKANEARIENFLRSDAVFDAQQYPEISFRSTSVTRTGGSTARIEGVLTARGKSRKAEFQATVSRQSGRKISFHVTGTIYRSPYGMGVGTPVYSNLVQFDMTLNGTRN